MRYAVSNIAWTQAERERAYTLLAEHGATGLEVAPGLLFAGSEDPFAPGAAELAAVQREIADAGLTLISMQSLLFGLEGASLFGDPDARAAFLTGIKRAIALAERLEIPNLVLGSPKQRRRPEGMDPDGAMSCAAEWLRPVADMAQAAGTRIAMECNPEAYGANFLTTPEDTLRFVARADHPAITLNFDIGALRLIGSFDRAEELLEVAAPVTSHVHLSEPFLAPAPAEPADAARILRKLRALAYDRSVSIEMRRPANGLSGLAEALQRLKIAQAHAGMKR